MTLPNVWLDDEGNGGFPVPSGKGQRLIVSHVGSSKSGFLRPAQFIFNENNTNDDYHGNFNSVIFLDWLKNKVLPHMPSGSVLVLDQAPYHRTLTITSQHAKSALNKPELADWLVNHDYPAEQEALMKHSKAELVQLCKDRRPTPVFEAILLGAVYNITVIFLPVAHPELNPIELIWAQVKGAIRRQNTDFQIARLRQLGEETMAAITPEDWAGAEKHSMEFEDKYRKMFQDDDVDFSGLDDEVFDEGVLDE